MVSAADPARIAEVARRLAAPVDDSVIAALASFADLLLTWNRRINLGGARLADEVTGRHLADALVAAPFLPDRAAFADVGTGGGLPAIPMLLLRPDTSVDLFEPTAKKVAFLRTAIRHLDLGQRARVRPTRLALPVQPELAGRFDAACSRATFVPADWLALGERLVRPGGRVIVFATGRERGPLPPAWREVTYASDRRLLVYETPMIPPTARST